MLIELRVERFKEEYVVAKINGISLKEDDILYKGFKSKEETIDFLKTKYEIESYNDINYEKYYKKEYRDVFYTSVTCIDGIELTTEELLVKLKSILGYIPYTLKHYRGRREGNFYQHENLWINSIPSGTYYIDDLGNVTIDS